MNYLIKLKFKKNKVGCLNGDSDELFFVVTVQGIEQIFLNIATGLIQMSGEELVTSLKIYDSDNYVASQTELNATDVGNTEIPSWSIDSIAHADSAKPHLCC